SCAVLAVHFQSPTVRADNETGQEQAHAFAAPVAAILAMAHRLPDLIGALWRDAHAGVADVQVQLVAGHATVHPHVATDLVEFNRVMEQMLDGFGQPFFVAFDYRQARIVVNLDANPAGSGHGRKVAHRLLHRVVEVQRREVKFLLLLHSPGDVDQMADHGPQLGERLREGSRQLLLGPHRPQRGVDLPEWSVQRGRYESRKLPVKGAQLLQELLLEGQAVDTLEDVAVELTEGGNLARLP